MTQEHTQEAAERHLDISHNHEAGLIPVSTRVFIRALAARLVEVEVRRDQLDALIPAIREVMYAEKARAEAAEAHIRELEAAADGDALTVAHLKGYADGRRAAEARNEELEAALALWREYVDQESEAGALALFDAASTATAKLTGEKDE